MQTPINTGQNRTANKFRTGRNENHQKTRHNQAIFNEFLETANGGRVVVTLAGIMKMPSGKARDSLIEALARQVKKSKEDVRYFFDNYPGGVLLAGAWNCCAIEDAWVPELPLYGTNLRAVKHYCSIVAGALAAREAYGPYNEETGKLISKLPGPEQPRALQILRSHGAHTRQPEPGSKAKVSSISLRFVVFSAAAAAAWLWSPFNAIPAVILALATAASCLQFIRTRRVRLRLKYLLLFLVAFVFVGMTHDAYFDQPSALCADGWYSYSTSRAGTCSEHAGVLRWRPQRKHWWEFGKDVSASGFAPRPRGAHRIPSILR